nr:hypothetical protein [Tanacetum cinerariifolium]
MHKMKILLILLFSTISVSLGQQSPDQVRDIDGNLVRFSAKYYILPVFRGRGGGLTLAATRIESCPLDVVQENMELIKGLQLAFTYVNPKKGIIRESTYWVCKPNPTIIISKLTYKLDGLLLLSPIGFRIEPQLSLYVRLGEMLGLGYLTIGIRARKPSPQTISNWFKIEKFDKDYKLVFCPTVCNFCKVVCGDIGVKIAENGKRRLAISDVPFKKA